MRAVVLLPDAKITDEQLSQALHYGATTLGLDTDFDGCMRIVAELTRTRPVYLLNSKNPVRIEGQKTIGWEAIHDLGWRGPGLVRRARRERGERLGDRQGPAGVARPRRHREEAAPRRGSRPTAADPFYQSYRTGFTERVTRVAGETAASAIRIGAPVSHPKAEREISFFDGVVARVTEAELLDAAALANRHGLAICPNSAVALAAARRSSGGGVIRKRRDRRRRRDGPRAQVLGDRRPRTTAAAARLANPPRRLPATLEAVLAALGGALESSRLEALRGEGARGRRLSGS